MFYKMYLFSKQILNCPGAPTIFSLFRQQFHFVNIKHKKYGAFSLEFVIT
jgi:hypothetical protein